MLENTIIGLLISWITVGSIYALASTGLAVIWVTTKAYNFGHGALMTLGGYLGLILVSILGMTFSVAFASIALIMFFVGFGLYFITIKPMLKRRDWETLIVAATLAVGLTLQSLLWVIMSPRVRSAPKIAEGTIYLGSSPVDLNAIAIIFVAISTLTILLVFLGKTKWGIAIRAVAQDAQTSASLGISVNRIFMFVTGLGSALAGIAGILLGSIYFVSPVMGFTIFVKAFLVVLFGGFGSLEGTIYASYIFGAIEVFAMFLLGANFALPVLFVSVMIVLVIRPTGLRGVKEE